MNFPAPNAMRAFVRAATAALAAVVLLGGCAAMSAQNPSGALRPVNAVRTESEARLMLGGADVVAYFTDGRHVPGDARHRAEFEGVAFHFASAEHRAMFVADPARYLPQFGGYCADGIVYGIPWGGDADTWRILDVPGNLALAHHYWDTEVRGSHSFWQRARRLVFRVPHYQSGEELARRVAAAKAGRPGAQP